MLGRKASWHEEVFTQPSPDVAPEFFTFVGSHIHPNLEEVREPCQRFSERAIQWV